MGFFGLKKKDSFVDLSEKYRKQQEKIKNIKDESKEAFVNNNSPQELPAPGIFGMFGGVQNNAEVKTEDAEEKRKKLAKRLMDMTNKIEDLSNQIFQLQQRVDELERRNI